MSAYQIVAHKQDGSQSIFNAISLFEAEFIRGEHVRGAYDISVPYTRVVVEEEYDIHGRQSVDGGICSACSAHIMEQAEKELEELFEPGL
ncbi:MAG: hypothetical protein GY832_46085 [Chloroflexi bacterium]|nr:hypothetical protein [Chloroflexota bacterium]